MFEEADSLGVSQGQGRGFAQVFDSTYNPVFKEETARLIKEDKEGKAKIEKDISGLDATVWKKAQPALREKMDDLYSYTMQNHRNINKGNTPEKLEYQKKISDIQLFTKEQKLQEDLWIKQFQKVAQDQKGTYEPEALDILQKYFDDPNLNDPRYIAELPLSFNALEHTGKLKNIVKDITTQTSLIPGFKDLNNNTIYQKFVKTVDSKIEDEAKNLWNNLSKSGKEHYDNDVNRYIQSAKNFARESASQTVKTPPSESLSKQAEQMKYIVKPNESIRISQKVGSEEGDKVGFIDDNTTSLYSVGFNASDEANLDPTQFRDLKGIVVSLGKAYQASGDKTKGYDVSQGLSIEDSKDFWKKLSGGAVPFKSEQINVVPVFKVKTIQDEKGRTIDVSNTILSDEHIKSGMFRGNKLTDDMVEFVPYVFGVYNKEVKKGKQENFIAGLPYDKYRDYMQTKSETRKQLLSFEEQMQDEDVLRVRSFTEGREQLGVKPNDNKQTKKEPSDTNNKIKQARTAYDALVKAAKEKGSTNIPTFEKYLELKGIK